MTGIRPFSQTKRFGRRSLPGFTIVELLMVIVVIGILAAITIVAISSAQQRARESSAASAVTQIGRKLGTYFVENGQYPSDLATIGIASTSQVTYQYSYNNTVNPKTYCVTATVGTVSYKGSQDTQPSAGGCAGHGQGGSAAISNLMGNPSVETNTSGWSVGSWGPGGAGSASLVGGGGASGNNSYRLTFTTAPTASRPYLASASSGVITPGMSYCSSAAVRPSWSGASFDVVLQWRDSGNTWISGVASTAGAAAAGSWTRYSACGTAPANAASVLILMRYSSGTLPPVNSTWDNDAAMLVEGTSMPSYADGNSTDWVWNGTPNNSTSTGPAS